MTVSSCKHVKNSRPDASGVSGIFVLANPVIGVEPAIEGLGVLDSAGIEFSHVVLLQEGAALVGEIPALALGITGVNRQMSKNVVSSLASPANDVFVNGFKGAPVDHAALSGTPACVSPRQDVNRIVQGAG
jgi:hypothetical protein